MTDADVAAGMTWGAMEMLAGGTTCVADMYEHTRAGASALAATGMRGNVCRVGLSFVPGRLDECIEFAKTSPGGRLAADICVPLLNTSAVKLFAIKSIAALFSS